MNKSYKKQKLLAGSISVFLAIIMLPMLTLAGSCADVARIAYARSMLESASELALNGLLSEYNRELYECYGLFALTEDSEELESLAYTYLEATLEGAESGILSDSYSKLALKRLFGSDDAEKLGQAVKISTCGVEVGQTGGAVLANTAVLENQICEYMKYRGPLEFGEELLNRFGLLSGLGSDSQAVSAELDYEKTLSCADDAAKELWYAFSAYICDLEEICGEKSPSGWVCENYEEYWELALAEKEAGNKTAGGDADSFEHEVKEKLSLLYNDIMACRNCCPSLAKALEKCESKRESWLESIENMSDGESKAALTEIYESSAAALSVSAVNAFYNCCDSCCDCWETVYVQFPSVDEKSRTAAFIDASVLEEDSECGELLRCLEKMYPDSTGSSSSGSGFISSLIDFANTLGITEQSGPSCVSETDDSGCLEEIEALAGLAESVLHTELSAGLSGESSEELSDSASQSLGSLTDIFSGLGSVLENTGENLLTLEYFAGMFSCASDAESGNVRESLSGQNLSGNVFYRYELEYILYGNDNIYLNTAAAYSSILAIRMGLNTLFAMTDGGMRSEALALATTVAGWTGFGIPVLQNAILLVWALAESVSDMNSLLDGQSVAVYKTRAGWTLSLEGLMSQIEGGTEGEKKTSLEKAASMSYRDYLMLFMLMESPFNMDGMLVRCAKLIQVNMNAKDSDFRLTEAFTAVNTECTALVNTFFIGIVYNDSTSAVSHYGISYQETGYGSALISSKATAVY